MNRSKYNWVIGFALALLATAPVVQAQSFEITPFFGYRVGGEFDRFDEDFGDLDFDTDIEVDNGESFGVIVDFPIGQNFYVELFASRQESELIFDGGLFEPDDTLFDIDVDYYHGGILYEWNPGQLKPFVVASAGVTQLSPNNGSGDETYFSASVGGGVKVFFSDNFGLRFEGRVFSTVVDEDDEVFCDRRYCYDYDDGNYLYQGEGRVGLILRF
ncbi:MAG: outer membrane beta-barrel protein [Acidobacteriota bacterium]